MTPSELTVRKVSHRGSVREWTLNPLWVRLDRRSCTRNSASSGCSWCRAASSSPIASFLGPDEKASFANALRRGAQRGQARADADGLI